MLAQLTESGELHTRHYHAATVASTAPASAPTPAATPATAVPAAVPASAAAARASATHAARDKDAPLAQETPQRDAAAAPPGAAC
jgi:hypothetical protein